MLALLLMSALLHVHSPTPTPHPIAKVDNPAYDVIYSKKHHGLGNSSQQQDHHCFKYDPKDDGLPSFCYPGPGHKCICP